jgi:serine kinase of HPr protein (carbohydrate metabolism regulator)
MMAASTVHASAVLVGNRAVLIRGAAGSGKSRLVLALLDAPRAGLAGFARLVSDDRVELVATHGRLLARPPATLAGLIEVRGIGIQQLPHEPVAVVGLVVDLAAADASRMPQPNGMETEIYGVRLPRLAIAAHDDPCSAVLIRLRGIAAQTRAFCNAKPPKNQ